MMKRWTGNHLNSISSRQRFRAFSNGATNKKANAWERTAVQVKEVELYNDKYIDRIRETHDPSLQIKTLEDELKGTIGKALGKQGEKILYNLQCMKQEYEYAVENNGKNYNQHVQKYNEYRKAAIQARWELMVHRQAAGFIIDNHQFVQKHYPIPDAISLSPEDSTAKIDNNNDDPGTKFTGQLDWWQRVGRWK